MTRRSFLTGGALGLAGAGALSVSQAYAARYIYPYRPHLERVALPLPAGHEALDGLRIGFVTDTHLGPFISAEDVQRAADLIERERPDLILLGGDYISESPRYIPLVAPVMSRLLDTALLGGVGVMGNHDLSVSKNAVQAGLEAEGIPILRNQVTSFAYNGHQLWIAGIDDTLVGDDQPAATLAQTPPGAAVLALWHEPEFAEIAAHYGAFAQISGHTHGGQIRLPGIGPVGLPIHGKRHVMGLDQAAGMPVYTSRGVGVYRPPVRFNCPPEVTLITLVARGDDIAS
jgi:predicted MPP superfamily phosphohydrolase